MADVLIYAPKQAARQSVPSAAGLWPVDKVILAYFAAAMLMEAIYRQPELIAIHVAALAVLWLAVKTPSWYPSFVFRHWYPLLYVAGCYREMSILIPIVRTWTADSTLAGLDFGVWQANPTVWLEHLQTPASVELFQVIYSTFLPVIILIGALLWLKRDFDDFRRYAFLLALGFLVSYIGYLLVPARGPRFLLAGLQTTELHGLWVADWLRALNDRMESAHYDCFPSGHTELTLLAWWSSRAISRNLSRVMFVYALGVIFATVYLRYHYTVDVLAGVLVAWALIVLSPRIYAALAGKAA